MDASKRSISRLTPVSTNSAKKMVFSSVYLLEASAKLEEATSFLSRRLL